jgi:hypothetical protein
MDFSEEDKIKATLLYHLRRKRMIGGAHTHYDTLKRGLPKHLGKEVEKSAKELIKSGLIITKPTSYGLQVSLNKEKLAIIDQLIFKVLGVGF